MSPILGIWASADQSQYISTNSFESIATVTVGAGGSSAIDFTSISSSYTHLQLRATMVCSATNNMYMQVGNGSIDTSGNYSWHQMYGDGANKASNGNSSTSFGYIGYVGNTAYPNAAVIDILDYANANKYKTWKVLSGNDINSGGAIMFFSGNWRSTSAVNAIRITPGSGNFSQYSSFALYGIKG